MLNFPPDYHFTAMGLDISKRLSALDAFRGLTIAGMILVNTPGTWKYVYPPLRHAKWEGCSPTDLVFPFFLFIVGVAMWFSFKKFDHKLTTAAFVKTTRRAFLIFVIGLALNTFPFYDMQLAEVRIMGVLQRIAVAFWFGALICLGSPRRFLPVVLVFILLFYWWMMWQFGGEDPYSLETNLARQVDLAILGEGHVYGGFGIPFDPEGLLSSIPAIGTVILGFLCGAFIDRYRSDPKFLWYFAFFGIITMLTGHIWGTAFPIIKALWTSSYVLYTGGLAMVILSLFLWLIDAKGWKSWAHPFIVFGLNPLFIYIVSILIAKTLLRIRITTDGGRKRAYQWLYEEIFFPIAGDYNGSLLFALSIVFICWVIAYLLYKRKIYIKV